MDKQTKFSMKSKDFILIVILVVIVFHLCLICVIWINWTNLDYFDTATLCWSTDSIFDIHLGNVDLAVFGEHSFGMYVKFALWEAGCYCIKYQAFSILPSSQAETFKQISNSKRMIQIR